jgi:hypothetical protein
MRQFPAWSETPAVRDGRIVEILQPGPATLTDRLDAIVAALWPDDASICFVGNYTDSTPHHSAMNSAVALVDLRKESRSTYSLKPCIAAPLAPKHRLGML